MGPLFIRTFTLPGGRKLLALCDADGFMLPGQRDVVLDQPIDAAEGVFTVSFVIDGKAVVMDTEAAAMCDIGPLSSGVTP